MPCAARGPRSFGSQGMHGHARPPASWPGPEATDPSPTGSRRRWPPACDGALLAVGHAGVAVEVRKVATLDVLHQLDKLVTSGAELGDRRSFSPQRPRLLAASTCDAASVWDLSGNTPEAVAVGRTGLMTHFTPAGTRFGAIRTGPPSWSARRPARAHHEFRCLGARRMRDRRAEPAAGGVAALLRQRGVQAHPSLPGRGKAVVDSGTQCQFEGDVSYAHDSAGLSRIGHVTGSSPQSG